MMDSLLYEAFEAFLTLCVAPSALIILIFFIRPFLQRARRVLQFLKLLRADLWTVRNKVVVITGASSGIGEQMAYEYARRGARLTLAARRQNRLDEVAQRCLEIGAAETATCRTDVSKEEDCRNLIEVTVERYGKVDVLVNNAGMAESSLFESYQNVDSFNKTMEVDFWGNVWPSIHALPHLRRSNGQIVVTASVGGYLTYPRQSFYNAAKAAVIQYYDTLRVEVGQDIAITVVMPGFVVSEMTAGAPAGHIPRWWPMFGTVEAAKAIVSAAMTRSRYLIVPRWYSAWLLYRLFAPELSDWSQRVLLLGKPPNNFVKDIADAALGEGVLERFLHDVSPVAATAQGK